MWSAVSRSRHILLDFDGPVCSIFAGTSAPLIAAQLRRKLQAAGITLPPEAEAEAENDPLKVFRTAAQLSDSVAELAQAELARLETLAVTTSEDMKPIRASMRRTYRGLADGFAVASGRGFWPPCARAGGRGVLVPV
jgi:hypothetical protein